MTDIKMDIQPIKTVTFFENILGIYRNIAAFGKLKRFAVVVRIVVEITIIIYNTHLHMRFTNSAEHQVERLYYYSSLGNSILFILLPCWYSINFLQFSKYLLQNHSLLQCNKNYLRKLKKLHRNYILFGVSFFVVHISTFILYRIVRPFNIPGYSIIGQYILQLESALCEHRFTSEYIALYIILTVMAEQLYYAVRSIDDVEMIMLGGPFVEGRDNTENIKELDKLCTIYTNIKEVSKLFNTMFGLQITSMLGSIVFYFIIFLYSMTSKSIKGELSPLNLVFLIFTNCLLLLTLALLSRSAQRTQNLAAAFRRRLGRMLIHSLDCPTEDFYKATKDLIRLVTTRPIRTQAFGSISVDMTLIPKCVLFFTYYVVIALQFNNVV